MERFSRRFLVARDKMRISIVTDGHPEGTTGAPGVECLRPRTNGQRSGGGEWEEKLDSPEAIARFGDILTKRGRSSRSGPVRFLSIRLSVDGSGQRGKVCARPKPAGPGGRRRGWRVVGGGWRGNGGVRSVKPKSRSSQ